MIRVGVIGCGYWGSNLVRVFHDGEASSVAAVCDLDSSRLAEVRRRYPVVEGHTAALELIARRDVDLVVVATPIDTHFSIARDALEAGKHVLVEKPFTQTSAQGEELIDLARCQGVRLAVDHTFLFTPAVEKMRGLIDRGEIGEINYIDSVRINLGQTHEEINVIWDLAPHDLSIIDYLVGREPKRILATGGCRTAGGQVNVAYMNLDFGNGLMANLHVNRLSPVKVRRMIFGGNRKMIIFDDLSTNEKVRVYDTAATPISGAADPKGGRRRRVDYRVGDIWTPYLPPLEALAVEAEHVISAIVEGFPLRVDGSAGLRIVRLLEACARSLGDDGGRVLLERSVAARQVVAHTPAGELCSFARAGGAC